VKIVVVVKIVGAEAVVLGVEVILRVKIAVAVEIVVWSMSGVVVVTRRGAVTLVRKLAMFNRCNDRSFMTSLQVPVRAPVKLTVKGKNQLHQFLRNKSVKSWRLPRLTRPQQVCNISDKSVTSWRGQKSVVSAVSCRFPNSITTTCCQLVMDLLAVSLISPQQVCNKLATSPSTGKLLGNVCNGFWALPGEVNRRVVRYHGIVSQP